MKTAVSLFVIAVLVTGLLLPLDVFADVLNPKKQVKLGIGKNEVFCKANLFKVIKKSTGEPSCVTPESAKKLVQRGWAQSVDTAKIDQLINALKSRTTAVGQVKKIAVLGVDADSKIFRSTPTFKAYKVVFEVCANDSTIRAPEVILASQTATSFVKIANDISANTCEINAGTVSAINPETIEVTLVNKGGITEKITQLESRVSELKQKLESEKAKLATRVQEGNKEKQSERIASIVELRTELNQAREELNRYLFTLNATPKTKSQDLAIPKTFAGTPIEGVTVNLLSANKQLVQEGFDVAFEMCAASQAVRVPMVIVSSDLDSKTVRLSDRIIPNTCQVSGAKIKASSADSIEVSIGDTSTRSVSAAEVEKNISGLEELLRAEKKALRNLTHLAPRPTDFNDQAAKIADNIIDLRNQLNIAKAQLYNLLNKAYK